MNKLAGVRCYLSGAIEHETAKEPWRQRLRSAVSDLAIQWLDPTEKEVVGRATALRHCGLYRDVEETMRQVRIADLQMVNESEIVVVYLDPKVPTFGTHEEMYHAKALGKIILIAVPDKTQAPLWLFGAFGEAAIHDGLWWLSRSLRLLDEIYPHRAYARHC